MSDLDPQEIRRWFPQKWSEFAGNQKIVQTWRDFLTNGPCNALFTGPSRTGKTRTVTLGIKALCCNDRTDDLNPCGRCPTCKALNGERHSHSGVFAACTGSAYTFKVIDCETVSGQELLELPQELNLDDRKTIIYLDEVAALGRRGLESLLLKPIDESYAIWLASAIKVKQIVSKKGKALDRNSLSFPVLGRFTFKVGTSSPSIGALTQWIKDRAQDWNIIIEEEVLSIPLMIKISERRVGFLILIFAAAASRGRRIDPDWLRGFNIGPED